MRLPGKDSQFSAFQLFCWFCCLYRAYIVNMLLSASSIDKNSWEWTWCHYVSPFNTGKHFVFFTCAHIFLWTENGTCISTQPDIKHTVRSCLFSKWVSPNMKHCPMAISMHSTLLWYHALVSLSIIVTIIFHKFPPLPWD